MEKLKSLGAGLLAVLYLVGGLLVLGAILGFGPSIALTIEPVVTLVAGIVLILNILIVLPLVLVPTTRSFGSGVMFVSSYVFGISTWLYGFAVTYLLLGLGWVVIGVFLLGVGVVPLGIIGAAIHAHWDVALGLALNLGLTFGARLLSIWAADHVPSKPTDHQKGEGRVHLDAQTRFSQREARIEEAPRATTPIKTSFGAGQKGEDQYKSALCVVHESGMASTALLQRRLHIPYPRAAHLIQRMEDEQLVGPADGARPRLINALKLKNVLDSLQEDSARDSLLR